jgi:hypothetical protein
VIGEPKCGVNFFRWEARTFIGAKSNGVQKVTRLNIIKNVRVGVVIKLNKVLQF